jgi:hypothetical protein
MAQEYKGSVVRISLAGISSPADVRLLNGLLRRVDGVRSHTIDAENNILTAYLDDETPETEEGLLRALLAVGMHPRGISGVGFDIEDGRNAC